MSAVWSWSNLVVAEKEDAPLNISEVTSDLSTCPKMENSGQVDKSLPALEYTAQDWRSYYHALVENHQKAGKPRNDSEWQAMNETFLRCCHARNVPPESDAGYTLMCNLITATGFNPVPVVLMEKTPAF